MKRPIKTLLPLLLFLILVPFSGPLDLTLARGFFDPQTGHFWNNAFLRFFYNYGPPLAITLTVLSIVYVAISLRVKSWRPYTRPLLVFILTYVIGSGLIINAGLKEFWGRPRPAQVKEFGGHQEFRPCWKPNFFNQPEPSKGFSCGHCSAAFVYLSLIVVGCRTRSRALTAAGWVLGIGGGIAMSFTRMAQGGHFLTDCLASGIVMWYTALVIGWLLYEE